jgi:hypothetical protein
MGTTNTTAMGNDQHGRVTCLHLQKRQFGPLGTHRARQVLIHNPFHQFQGPARADSRHWTAVDGDRAVQVVARDHRRPFRLFDVAESGQRNHRVDVVADLDCLEVFDLVAELLGRLDIHLPCAAEAIEVVDV